MKKIIGFIALALLFLLPSCELDLYPETGYNEGNVKVESQGKEEESPIQTRSDIQGLRNSIYSSWTRDIQEKGYMDWLVYSECRADNAYCGNMGTGEIVAIEANRQDGENKNVVRDWDWYLGQIGHTNDIICNIDRVRKADPSMTDAEYGQWLSEAYCWRAWNLFQMSYIYGDIPMVETIPPAINAENIEEVYADYFPARTPVKEIYEKLAKNLEFAAEHAPDMDPANKGVFTKAFALGMLARIYAEAPIRDWGKVDDCCRKIEGMGYTLVDDYGSLWGYDDHDAFRNSSESIFEVPFSKAHGNWVYMMFHRNAYDKMSSYSWVKWITPSRDLIAAYDKEGDTERKNGCIVFDECIWSDYYPNTQYAFMHKVPTNATSIILMRLGEIYLLHAEALANKGDLKGAADYVNKIRQRAGLKPIAVPASAADAIDAVLHERRLELAFEGFRFYDLARYGLEKVKDIHDKMPSKDSHWQSRQPLSEETLVMPIPQTALEVNPSLTQNPGY